MRAQEFDFPLPRELIAQRPAVPRDSARLLVIHRDTGRLEHRVFRDLPSLLEPGDLLLLNDTRVVKARLRARRKTGGRVELLVLSWEKNEFVALAKPARRLRPPEELALGPHRLTITHKEGARVRGVASGLVEEIMADFGEVPLPPYIKRQASPEDADWYQSVMARRPGSVAAPTASLHFTQRLLRKLRANGIRVATFTLHVGYGTFAPLEDEIEGHRMEAERYSIPRETVEAIKGARRVIPVGTTAVRALETWAETGATRGETRLFIYPGFKFKATGALITNFHMPRSTPLLLAAAFAGWELLRRAYSEAIQRGYRFGSYGDGCLIL